MDSAALTSAYVTYGYLVYRRCSRLLRPADAEDVVQEVFLRLATKGGPAQGQSLLGWLYTVAVHCSVDVLRQRGREVTPDLERPPPSQATEGEQGFHRALLFELLGKVDTRTAEAGLLYHWAGLTQDEVAARLGWSRRTVGKKLQLFEKVFSSDDNGGEP